MASFMPTACCAAGYQHDGTPTGDVTAFEDLEIYTAKPSVAEPKKAILYLSDIYGFPVVNHKLLSDNFAKQGYLTIYPNLFGDDPAPWPRTDEFDFPAWREVHNIEVTEAIINKAIAYTKKEFPSVVQFFAVGYCFGGKYVVRLLDQAKIDAGFVAHPTFVTDEELRAIQGPLSIAAAEVDHLMPEEKRHLTERILKEIGATYILTLYSQVEHGFAVRGNPNEPATLWANEAAFIQAVQWFNRFSK
ncbi:dienelactone hydrolase [Kockiozyma suomiensis]|uniref:dienelactone hydrolase n=1 Tax=Kockiozyma suomiensis TaxID=1337062 RepID=UPI003342EDE7